MDARAERFCELPWAYAGLVALPVVALFLCEGLIAWLGQQPNVPDACLVCYAQPASTGGGGNATRWLEASARMRLLAMFALFFIFSAAVIAKFWSDLSRLFANPARFRVVVAYGLGVGAAAVVVVSAYVRGGLPRAMDMLGCGTFVEALGMAASFGGGPWGGCAFDRLLDVTNVVAGFTIPAFVAGGISCLARSARQDALEKENWTYQAERLKTYIYMSTAFLVLGVLYFATWTGYPSFALSPEARPAFEAAVNAFTMYTGIEYSIILAAYALPVAWIVSRRADRIAAHIAAEECGHEAVVPLSALKEIREREGLAFSTSDTVKAVLALLAPLITGTLPSLTAAVG